jgi:hypothetical protein
MNKYYLKILHPGNESYREIIDADGYWESSNAYCFFVYAKNNRSKNPERIVRCVYPVELTIITNIEYALKT